MPKLYCYDGPERSDPHAVVLELSEDDFDAFNDLPRGEGRCLVAVDDQATGRRYSVRRAACGAACYCAAEAVNLA